MCRCIGKWNIFHTIIRTYIKFEEFIVRTRWFTIIITPEEIDVIPDVREAVPWAFTGYTPETSGRWPMHLCWFLHGASFGALHWRSTDQLILAIAAHDDCCFTAGWWLLDCLESVVFWQLSRQLGSRQQAASAWPLLLLHYYSLLLLDPGQPLLLKKMQKRIS